MFILFVGSLPVWYSCTATHTLSSFQLCNSCGNLRLIYLPGVSPSAYRTTDHKDRAVLQGCVYLINASYFGPESIQLMQICYIVGSQASLVALDPTLIYC